jgi:chloramphenicol 3-O phosphotransferase
VTKWPNIILVNGSSSAGKSMLCQAMQNQFLHPYMHVQFDDFVFMMPKRYYSNADTALQTHHDEFTRDGVTMIETQKRGEPVSIKAVFGPVFRHMLDAMAPAVRTLVDNGNSVIFDHCLHDEAMYDSCVKAFAGLTVLKVGVYCPLAVLEQRERERGDRVIGRARGLFDVVHRFCDYDVSVDTSALSTEACVAAIQKSMGCV